MYEEYFSVEEFAKMLKVPVTTIRKAIRNGRIHAFRPGIGKRSPYRICGTEFIRIMQIDFETMKKEREEN